MRNEFYGDSRDVAKWSELVRIAKDMHFKKVLYVALLRKDEKKGEGLVDHPVKWAEPEIERFFKKERERFEKDESLRKVSNVRRLGPRLGLDIEVVDRLWKQSDRNSYFETLSFGGKLLVFLDPDTGIASEKKRSFGKKDGTKWIKASEVAEAFDMMTNGAVLVVYQHNTRRDGWVEDKRKQLHKALGAVVTSKPAGQVAFLVCTNAKVK